MHSLDLIRVEGLVLDEVVEAGNRVLRGRSRRGRVRRRESGISDADVAVAFPHGEGAVGDVPGAGEQGERWGSRGRGGGGGVLRIGRGEDGHRSRYTQWDYCRILACSGDIALLFAQVRHRTSDAAFRGEFPSTEYPRSSLSIAYLPELCLRVRRPSHHA